MAHDSSLKPLARRVAEVLLNGSRTLVLAESCTCGLIAATLGTVPGVSRVLAGSAVVYQLETKSSWLRIDETLLEDPGPVSQVVAVQMAEAALRITPHADIAMSITGHLGPDSPEGLDGVAFSALSQRHGATICRQLLLRSGESDSVTEPAESLSSVAFTGHHRDARSQRVSRQQDAVRQCLEFMISVLHGNPS